MFTPYTRLSKLPPLKLKERTDSSLLLIDEYQARASIPLLPQTDDFKVLLTAQVWEWKAHQIPASPL